MLFCTFCTRHIFEFWYTSRECSVVYCGGGRTVALGFLLWSTMSSRGCCSWSCSMLTTFLKPKLTRGGQGLARGQSRGRRPVQLRQGYVCAMSVIGPCPDTNTHLSWKLVNACRGLYDKITWSGLICAHRSQPWSNHNAPKTHTHSDVTHLHIKQRRQLLRFVFGSTTCGIGKEDDRQQEVTAVVKQLPQGSPRRRDDGAAAHQHTVYVQQDARFAPLLLLPAHHENTPVRLGDSCRSNHLISPDWLIANSPKGQLKLKATFTKY